MNGGREGGQAVSLSLTFKLGYRCSKSRFSVLLERLKFIAIVEKYLERREHGNRERRAPSASGPARRVSLLLFVSLTPLPRLQP